MSRVYGELQHNKFKDLSIPLIYTFENIDVFLKCSFLAIERGFKLVRCPTEYEVHREQQLSDTKSFSIATDKQFKLTLKNPSIRFLTK